MKTLVNVARYHLVDRMTYLALPWGIMAFSFLVNLAIAAWRRRARSGNYTGGLVTHLRFPARLRCAEHDQVAAVRADARGQPPQLLPRHRPAGSWRSASSTASR